MLDLQYSRERQRRLAAYLQAQQLDAAVLSVPHHVYYFSGFLPRWTHQSALVVFDDGTAWLTVAERAVDGELEAMGAADRIVTYEADWGCTLRQEQAPVVAAQVVAALQARNARRVGIDASPVAALVALRSEARLQSIDEHLWQMRRCKDPDELALMQQAIGCTAAMYRRAQEIIEPGVPELYVFAELHRAAVEEAGEPLTALLGNDFACGCMGGPPRPDRRAQAGELYILDLGPAYRGYFADNCRTFAVDRHPTDLQRKAHEVIIGAFPLVEEMARPGVRCRDLYTAIEAHFQAGYGVGLAHHLGHGVGLQPHEFPHHNPQWDDVLMEGEVITVEPGIYSDALAGGIRIENNYLVTATGVRSLLDYPLALA
jgi:Xaa-Pro aminopeptidase